MESSTLKPRRPWLAALFSLIGGPLGHVYCGYILRGSILWFSIIFLVHMPAVTVGSIVSVGRIANIVLLLLCVLAAPLLLSGDAFLLARRNRTKPRRRYQRWWFYLLFYIGFYFVSSVLAFGVKTFVTETFVIPTGSMSPALQPGDRIFVDKLWYNPSRLKYNDLVVFCSQARQSNTYIMRVVGLPGDQIEIKDEELFVNGSPFDDQYANVDKDIPLYHKNVNYGPYTVPEASFFVLGDNRRNSVDSRMIGAIPFPELVGRAYLIYWSRERRSTSRFNPNQYENGPIRWEKIGMPL